jgi:hypothetical protein
MVCSALRGLFVYRNELKRPDDRYHPPSLCWGISRVLLRVPTARLVRADGCTVLTGEYTVS